MGSEQGLDPLLNLLNSRILLQQISNKHYRIETPVLCCNHVGLLWILNAEMMAQISETSLNTQNTSFLYKNRCI